MMTVAEAIKKIRYELRMSQADLAAAIHCTQTAISAYETEMRLPRYDILKRLDTFAKKNNLDVKFL